MNIDQLSARTDQGLIHVIVDTPKGSRNKYKYDEQSGLFKLSHVLPQGMCFPFDFGSVPGTAAADGDPLDVLVLQDEPSFAGCLLTVRFIGVIEAQQTQKNKTARNDRLLAVAETSVNRPAIKHIKELDRAYLDELELFFVAYNHAHGRAFKALRRSGPQAADRLLNQAILDFEQRRT